MTSTAEIMARLSKMSAEEKAAIDELLAGEIGRAHV